MAFGLSDNSHLPTIPFNAITPFIGYQTNNPVIIPSEEADPEPRHHRLVDGLDGKRSQRARLTDDLPQRRGDEDGENDIHRVMQTTLRDSHSPQPQ